MLYLAVINWMWLLPSLLIGFAMGWISVVQRGHGLSDATMKKCAIVLAAFVLVSLLRLIPGRAGYWLDLGLVMFAVYILGCAIGSWLRSQVVLRGAAQP
jgi:hypothetical protein